MDKQPNFFDKTISMGQLLLLAATIVGTAITFYTQTEIRLKELELRMTLQERKIADFNSKMDLMIQGQNDIKIILENKADRK